MNQLSALNVDVIGATSTILGVAPRARGYRPRMATLGEFDVRWVDRLEEYATACWFAACTNLPHDGARDFEDLIDEAKKLRSHLLNWATPFAEGGVFAPEWLAKIRKGSGRADLAGDVVALVTLFRDHWERVRDHCGVTVAELDRGAILGMQLFTTVAERKWAIASSAEGTMRVRRFWTLADRAYDECRRAITFLEWRSGRAQLIVPSLRRNSGTKSAKAGKAAASLSSAPAGGAPRARDLAPIELGPNHSETSNPYTTD